MQGRGDELRKVVFLERATGENPKMIFKVQEKDYGIGFSGRIAL